MEARTVGEDDHGRNSKILAALERGMSNLIWKRILATFRKVPLTAFERTMAHQAVTEKYAPAVTTALAWTFLLTPSFLTLDTEIVVSVLLPTTMVAGTAWFAVSLASMKKKFESFGTELTRDLFIAFSLSLLMLMLATAVSLTADSWRDLLPELATSTISKLVSAALALLVVGKLLFSIFAGALKYDINDAMLSGQNEVAEKFFKESLSLLYTTAQLLRTGPKLEIANYYLGLCFYEIFNDVSDVNDSRENLERSSSIKTAIEKANLLIRTPERTQKEADSIVRELIELFVGACSKRYEIQEHRSYEAIKFELGCLQDGTHEQSVVDIRTSVVLREMSNLMDRFGAGLFSDELAAE